MADAAVMQQLAPTGKLRVAIAVAPAPSAQFAIKDGDGYKGVAVALGNALAAKLGVPAALIAQLLPVLQKRFGKRAPSRSDGKTTMVAAEYSAKSANEIMPRDVEVALHKIRGSRKFSLAHTTIGWAGDVQPRGYTDIEVSQREKTVID